MTKSTTSLVVLVLIVVPLFLNGYSVEGNQTKKDDADVYKSCKVFCLPFGFPVKILRRIV
jgi:hypothetical protein